MVNPALTSSMLGIGKKTGWNAWMNFTEATETTMSLIDTPQELTEKFSAHAATYGVLYSTSCPSVAVNEARRLMFEHSQSQVPRQHHTYESSLVPRC